MGTVTIWGQSDIFTIMYGDTRITAESASIVTISIDSSATLLETRISDERVLILIDSFGGYEKALSQITDESVLWSISKPNKSAIIDFLGNRWGILIYGYSYDSKLIECRLICLDLGLEFHRVEVQNRLKEELKDSLRLISEKWIDHTAYIFGRDVSLKEGAVREFCNEVFFIDDLLKEFKYFTEYSLLNEFPDEGVTSAGYLPSVRALLLSNPGGSTDTYNSLDFINYYRSVIKREILDKCKGEEACIKNYIEYYDLNFKPKKVTKI